MKKEFLNKAKENLKIAQLSFEHDCYNACANRAYYAAFQAAIAALADKGIRSEKNDHSWVQSEFTLRLIKRQKIYPAKIKAYLPDMQQARNKADYSEKDISKKVSREQLSRATEMIRIIEKEIGK
ncbi:MAG: HEPN domain-containing protein [Desulfobacterales bacterium]|nr:HEPN domain-containing protein [Desulfobacterales bacterium]